MGQPPLLDRIRTREWRITAQRHVVAEILDGQHVHLSADEVFERAQQRLPQISLATVYNTLNELVAMGEVREFRGRGGGVRYDPNAGSHHHLLCDGCGTIFDVAPTGVDGLTLDGSHRHGFRVDAAEIVFHGRCPACR